MLSSCASYGYFTEKKSLQSRVDDAKILLSAVAQEVGESAKTGIMEPDDAQEKLDDLGESRKKLKTLSRMLLLGDDSKESLEDKLTLITQGALNIQNYISKKAKEAKQ